MSYVQEQTCTSNQAKFIAATLGTWAEQYGGRAVVVSNLRDLWEQASKNSQTPLIYVCYMGEEAWGDFDTRALTHRVKRNWVVSVQKGRGFAAVRGTSLTDTYQNAQPFYDSVEAVRDQIRAMFGVSADAGIDFASIKPMQLGNQIIDAYMIEFSAQTDLPPILQTLDNPA